MQDEINARFIEIDPTVKIKTDRWAVSERRRLDCLKQKKFSRLKHCGLMSSYADVRSIVVGIKMMDTVFTDV